MGAREGGVRRNAGAAARCARARPREIRGRSGGGVTLRPRSFGGRSAPAPSASSDLRSSERLHTWAGLGSGRVRAWFRVGGSGQARPRGGCGRGREASARLPPARAVPAAPRVVALVAAASERAAVGVLLAGGVPLAPVGPRRMLGARRPLVRREVRGRGGASGTVEPRGWPHVLRLGGGARRRRGRARRLCACASRGRARACRRGGLRRAVEAVARRPRAGPSRAGGRLTRAGMRLARRGVLPPLCCLRVGVAGISSA